MYVEGNQLTEEKTIVSNVDEEWVRIREKLREQKDMRTIHGCGGDKQRRVGEGFESTESNQVL